MPRKYKRIVGKKGRATINIENLEKAIEDIRVNGLSITKAAKKYDINRQSIFRRLKNPATRTLSANVISGFRKCGIHPLSLPEMLRRLPKEEQTVYHEENVEETLDNSFIGFLQQLQPKEQSSSTRKKQQKIKSGRSVSAEDLLEPSIMEELLEPQPSTSGTQSKQKKNVVDQNVSCGEVDQTPLMEIQHQEPQPSTSGTQPKEKKKRGRPQKQPENKSEAVRKSKRVKKGVNVYVPDQFSSEDEEEPFAPSDTSSD